MEDRRTPCTAEEAHRHADMEAVQPAPVVADVAAVDPEAEVVPDLGAATITVAPDLGPTPGLGQGPGLSLSPSQSPNPELPEEASQSLHQGLGHDPGPSQGVGLHLPTGDPSLSPDPGPNPRVGLNLQRTTEQSLNPSLDTI